MSANALGNPFAGELQIPVSANQEVWNLAKKQELSRRNFLELAGAVGAAQLSSAALAQDGKPLSHEEKPPNFVFLLGDDHRADVMGCAGNAIVHTPQMDRLAAEGALFENHFCTTPICCASRASIMTGQYAATTGIYDFVTDLTPQQVQTTYWARMKQAGYHTGFIGKFGVGDHPPHEAFDYWEGFAGQGSYFPKGPTGPHLTDITTDQAVEFLTTAPREKPFCLSISYKAPHVQDEDPRQYLPSPSTLALYEGVTIPPPSGAGPRDIGRFPLAMQHSENRRRWGIRFSTPDLYQASMKGYYRLISGTDGSIGSIRETLAKLGLAGNTIIVYSADHGIFNGEHGLAGKWYGHEESIRTPLLVYDPRLPSSLRVRRVKAMTLNIDLQPTLLELAHLDVPKSTQGRSLAALLHGQDAERRRVWFMEHHFPDLGWIPSSEAIRTERWKYIRYTDVAAPFEELYDLENDRSETNNLAGVPKYAAQQRALSRYRDLWRESLLRNPEEWTDPVTEKDLVRDGLV